jgi:WD40 repeat protein
MKTIDPKVTLVHPGPASCLAFTPDGNTLAVGTRIVVKRKQIGVVKLWDLLTGKERATLDGHKKWGWSLGFSPDATTLAVGSYKEVKLWDLTTGRLRSTLEGYPNMVWSLAFTPDGNSLITTGSQAKTEQLYRWDLATEQCKASPRGHRGGVWVVAISPDGRMLATGGDGTVKLWDMATDEEIATFQAHKRRRCPLGNPVSGLRAKWQTAGDGWPGRSG